MLPALLQTVDAIKLFCVKHFAYIGIFFMFLLGVGIGLSLTHFLPHYYCVMRDGICFVALKLN